MQDDVNTQVEETAKPTTGNEVEVVEKTLTQEELNKVVQERVAREQAKAQKLLEQKEKEFTEKLEQEKRLASLKAEEREKELLKIEREELEKEKQGITIERNTLYAKNKLLELGIDTELVKYVVDLNSDKMEDNIATLKSAYDKAIERGIQDKLKGQTPKDMTSNNSTPKSSVPRYF